jgi:hypothetical protein
MSTHRNEPRSLGCPEIQHRNVFYYPSTIFLAEDSLPERVTAAAEERLGTRAVLVCRQAAFSRTLSPSSSCAVIPASLIALSCWERLSERGTVLPWMVAIVLSGTSWLSGPVT